jgi:hypothetical protein
LQIDSSLHFDQFCFQNRPFRACTPESHLSFQDIGRMHVERRKTFRFQGWIPGFAGNQSQFRRVILCRALAWCGPHTRPGAPMPDFATVKRLVDAKFEERAKTFRGKPGDIQYLMFERFKNGVRKAGGYLEFIGALSYRSWLLGMDSCTVAASLGVSPQCVRQQLCRLCATARRLGYEGHTSHWSRGLPRRPTTLARRRAALGLPETASPRMRLRWTQDLVSRVEGMRKLGWTWYEIGEKIGCSVIAAKTAYLRLKDRPRQSSGQ